MKQSIVYIGDFDFINHNVQSHLVYSNGQIFENLGYEVHYIGMKRRHYKFESFSDGNFYHLPDTLSIRGILFFYKVNDLIRKRLEEIDKTTKIAYVVVYQAPTFSPILYFIHSWCKNHEIKFIANSADLPVFKHGSFFVSSIMYLNWSLMHSIIRRKADGIIAVSSYIDNYFKKKNRPSIVIPPLFDGTTPESVKNLRNIREFVYAGSPFVVTGKKVTPQGMKDRLDFILTLFYELNKRKENFFFKIIGITIEEYLVSVPEHRKLLETLNGKVKFLGLLSHEKVIEQITHSDFMINYRDVNKMTLAGYSTKVVESVSLGTPVIVNDIGDTFRYLSNEMGFILTGNEVDDISILQKACSLPKSRIDNMKVECLKNNPFVKENYIEKMSKFLKDVMEYGN